MKQQINQQFFIPNVCKLVLGFYKWKIYSGDRAEIQKTHSLIQERTNWVVTIWNWF